jgi:hypothetical protein
MPANTPSDTDANDTGSSLHWGTSSFEPGGDVGLVSRHTVGLIERDNPSTRERLWQLVADDAPLDDILDELSSTGLKALPDFGIAQVEGGTVRVVARGRTTISAELASGDEHEIDPSGVRTWIEEVVSDVVALTIALAASDDDGPSSTEAFAVLAGSVPARSVTRRFDVADPHAAEAIDRWAAQPGEPDAASVELDGPQSADVADDAAAASEPVAETDAGGSAEPDEVEPEHADEGGSWYARDGDDAPDAEVPPQPAGPPPASPQPASPQPASPQPAGPPVVDAQPASRQPAGPPVADPQPASPQPSGPPAVGASADPIGSSAADGPSGPPPSGPGAGGPPPEATVVVGPADGPVRGPVSSIFDDEEPADPVVPTLPNQDPTVIPEPGDTAVPVAATVYGILAFSNGERINVDRSVLIGRNPKVAGAIEGGLPHIMKFEGPGQGLSRTHAEVRIVGGEMLLEDLQSTNGTEIQLPGQQRRRLRGGEPVAVVPGTLIDFGDELHCTVETAG